ncbi:MAG: hypothetical protein QOJ63_312 [Solirubrobacteraceae bacterium]|jgi:hypothetical protein|nr:hypothetical protein [Solirubrobacteraceae bacterium]
MSREPSERSGASPRARTGGGRSTPPARPDHPAARGGDGGRAAADLARMLVAFAACSAIAGLAGAPNLGTALTFGQIGFALAAVYALLGR